MNRCDDAYKALLSHVLETGEWGENRTGVDTISTFGYQFRTPMDPYSFPIVTLRRIYWPAVVHETLWNLRGDTHIDYLKEHGIRIWDPWADESGHVGPIYGYQWRHWWSEGGRIDQIANVIKSLRENPTSRRHIVSAWNVSDLEEMCLPPCPVLMQFHVRRKELHCQVYQRSADLFHGFPFDLAGYSLLSAMIAWLTDLIPGEIIFSLGDAHIYENHVDHVKTMLSRKGHPAPTLVLNTGVDAIDDFTHEDIRLLSYEHDGVLSADVAV